MNPGLRKTGGGEQLSFGESAVHQGAIRAPHQTALTHAFLDPLAIRISPQTGRCDSMIVKNDSGFAATQALMTGLLEELAQAALEALLPRPLAADWMALACNSAHCAL